MTSASSKAPVQSALLGYIFLAYALFCLLLSLSLIQLRAVQNTANTAMLALPSEPKLAIHAAPDFSQIDSIKEKKARFFQFLHPAVDQQNQYFSELRRWLKREQQRLSRGANIDSKSIAHLAKRYRIVSKSDVDRLHQLLIQIDEIPTALVLAQAANESAWGTSRFAKQANNYFGQWCFKKGCGLIPQQRSDGASHEVKYFDSAQASVAAYFRNINSNKSYRDLWLIRQQLRQENKPLTGQKLAEGLIHYSSRGSHYIDELQAMIRFNKLDGPS